MSQDTPAAPADVLVLQHTLEDTPGHLGHWIEEGLQRRIRATPVPVRVRSRRILHSASSSPGLDDAQMEMDVWRLTASVRASCRMASVTCVALFSGISLSTDTCW